MKGYAIYGSDQSLEGEKIGLQGADNEQGLFFRRAVHLSWS
jgi:hypothetical protein